MFQFVEIDGVRNTHIINPKTGLGSVEQAQGTVISENGMFADTFALALTLMGPKDGIGLINSLENTEAIIFRSEGGKSGSGNLKYLISMLILLINKNNL